MEEELAGVNDVTVVLIVLVLEEAIKVFRGTEGVVDVTLAESAATRD